LLAAGCRLLAGSASSSSSSSSSKPFSVFRFPLFFEIAPAHPFLIAGVVSPTMAKSPKNTLLVAGLSCFIAGWILMLGSQPFVRHFMTRKGAKVVLAGNAQDYRLMSELVEDLAKTKSYTTSLQPFGHEGDSFWCTLFVDAGTTGESIDAANRFADELRAEFARRSREAPGILHHAEPVPIVTSLHWILSILGRIAGVILLGSSVVIGILHFVKVRKGTPPPLPGQENAGDSATYDY
jgi:hypothetical protein